MWFATSGLAALALQAMLGPPTLLTVPLDGRPVRFGAPLPATALLQGLRLVGRGTLQWRPLPMASDGEIAWVELAITGPPGTVRIVAGGEGPSDAHGPSYRRETHEHALAHGTQRVVRWTWCDGTVDEHARVQFTATATIGGETFGPGEFLSVVTPGTLGRADVLCRLGANWARDVGVLPRRGGGGEATRAVRAQLAKVLPRLQELPGARGAGDYGRSGGVVTNLEFDTTFALLRCALGLGDVAALARARRAAQHLVDRDLHAPSGLPFAHGTDHRSAHPEPGHVWLQGLLWVGLLTAEDALLTAARGLGHAIAAHPPHGEGKDERLRDYAWPLLELEALLRIAPEVQLAKAADAYAASIARRFDAASATFRFGEGDLGGGVYWERGWLTGGLLLPALRDHLSRRHDVGLADLVARADAALRDRLVSHGEGLPTHWRIAGGRTFAVHRAANTAEAAFALEALAPPDLARVLRRATVRAALADLPHPDDPDLATQVSLLARCDWPWR